MERKIDKVKNRRIKGSSIHDVKFIDEESIQITFKSGHHILLQSKSTGYGGETSIFITKDTLKEQEYDY